jgi:hypothetical protein
MYRLLLSQYYILAVPISILFILNSRSIHSSYRLPLVEKFRLGSKMALDKFRIPTGTSYKAHLAMALKIFETLPEVKNDIVECGTWKGGSVANLSLVCRITGRKLKIYDSFQGLPESEPADRQGLFYKKGEYLGTLDEVKSNISRYGAIECCEFIKGWFSETLPRLDTPVLLAFLDVDLEASLETCVRHLWPNLTDKGYVFIDEYVDLDYCSLFWSEKYRRTHFQRTPPGLVGAGVGLALGEYYIGSWSEIGNHPLQHPNAGEYAQKDFSGHWAHD